MTLSAHVYVDDTHVPLDTLQSCATPEHIEFSFRLAGPLQRGLAWVIDGICKCVVVLIVVLCVMLMVGGDTQLLGGAGFLLWFIFLWVSDVWIEWRWSGYTVGKKMMGIRVLSVDGLPVSFSACFIRNTLRWADWLPFGFGVGLFTMVCSSSFRRLGDLAAGTIVIAVDAPRQSVPPVIKNKKVALLVALLPDETHGYISPVSARAIALYAMSRLQYHPDRRNEIAQHLSAPLALHLQVSNEEPDILLSALYMKLFHAGVSDGTGAQAGSSPMTSRAAQCIAQRRAHWDNLEGMLSRNGQAASAKTKKTKKDLYPPVTRTVTAAMPVGQPAVLLAQEYRSACADLALAEAYHLPPQNIAYLHSLVSRSHILFYRHVEIQFRHMIRVLFYDTPAQIIRDPCVHISTLIFFGSFIMCFLLGSHMPFIAESYIGEATLMQMLDMYSTAPDTRRSSDAAFMSGFYIANNVGIAFSAFAFGIFAGIGSIIMLAFNGIYLGLIFGYMSSAAVDPITQAHFFEFVRAHGPFELTGIMLAGAAGLRLGMGMLLCYGAPRLESLQRSARESVPLMCMAALSVAVAAPIEAFISPSAMTLGEKTMVGVCSALILVLYFALGFSPRRASAPLSAKALSAKSFSAKALSTKAQS